MEKTNQFSPQRFTLLMKRHTLLNAKTWLIGLGAISGVIIMVSLLQAYFGSSFNLDAMSGFGITMIMVSGYMITSTSYNEIHTPARSQFFLTLPATTGEKLFSHWMITSIIYIGITFILLSVTLGAATLLASLFFGTQTAFFNPFTQTNLHIMGIYIVTHSIFFLGALYFRKNNLLKTLLSIFVVIMVLSLLASLIGYLIFGPGSSNFNITNDQLPPNMYHLVEKVFPMILKIVFWGLIAPFFLLVSYFKLKEREV